MIHVSNVQERSWSMSFGVLFVTPKYTDKVQFKFCLIFNNRLGAALADDMEQF